MLKVSHFYRHSTKNFLSRAQFTWTNKHRDSCSFFYSRSLCSSKIIFPPQMVNQNGKSVVVRITEAQSEPNETSPLKSQTKRENNSDASSSASAVTSEQSAKQLMIDDMTGRSKNVALKVGIDFLLLCIGKQNFSVNWLFTTVTSESRANSIFAADKIVIWIY